MIRSPFIRSIAVVLLLSVSMFTALPALAAYDPSQLTSGLANDATGAAAAAAKKSTSLSDLLNKRGLSAKKYSDLCLAGTVFSIFSNSLEQFANQLITTLGATINTLITSLASQLITCQTQGLLKKFTGLGTECTQPVNSDYLAYQIRQAIENQKKNFLARCVVDQGINDIAATVDQMIQEQGPGGEAAWAQNWTKSAYVEPDEMAHRRFWSELVNAKICPYLKDDIYDYFDVPDAYRETPPNIDAIELRVDAGDPFTLTAACTLPDGYDPSASLTADGFIAMGGYEFLAKAFEPQNTLDGLIDLGNAELSKQRAAMTESANSQLIAGGGFLPVYGDATTNCLLAPDGNGCINYGTIKQPSGAVKDMRNLSLQGQMDFLNKTSDTDKAIEDMATRIQARLLDLVNQPIPINLELGLGDNPDNFTPAPTPSPVPGSGSIDDPVCTGGNPQCHCIANDASAQLVATSVIAPAMKLLLQNNPTLFVTGTNQIAPGIDNRAVLQALCNSMSNSATCKPHPIQNNQIVLVTGAMSLGFDVITPDGYLRTNGGKPVAACELGVQD